MNPVLFQLKDSALDGKYLSGFGQWGQDMVIGSALVAGVPPSSGTVSFQLEVNGTLTGDEMAVERFPAAIDLAVFVPLGHRVRWRVSYGGDASDAAMEVSLSMNVSIATPPPHPSLTVNYVNGRYDVEIYRYDAATQLFSAAPAGGGGTGLISAMPGFELSMAGNPVLQFFSGVIRAQNFIVGPVFPAGVLPRVEFRVDGAPVLIVNVDGYASVPNLTGGDPPALSSLDTGYWNRFLISDGAGQLAQISAAGILAPDFVEGVV